MKLSGFASLLAVAVAFSAAGIGCEDDVPTPKRDASAGKDGSAGAGGTGGRDASVDTGGGGSGGADASADRTPDASADARADVPVTPDAPPDTAPIDAPPDTAPPDTAPIDAPADTAPPDTAPPDTAPADTASDTSTDAAMVVTECEDIPCPALVAATSQCLSDDVMCSVRDVTVAMGPETKNICLMNGVKKLSVETDNGFTITVHKAAGAGVCYTLDIDSPDNLPEVWIYKAPGGAELARVSVDTVNDRSILTCAATGATFDVTNAGCDGLEGEGDGCATDPGTCVVP